MPTLDDIRQQYPQYNDLNDQQLVDGLHQKFYSDMPAADFYGKIGYKPQPTPQQQQAQGSYAGEAVSNPDRSWGDTFKENFEQTARNGTGAGALSNLLINKADKALPDLPKDNRAEEADEYNYKNGPSWRDQPTLAGKASQGSAALLGSLAGGLTSPESYLGLNAASELAAPLTNIALSGAAQAGINTVIDPLIQQLNVNADKAPEKPYDQQSDLEKDIKAQFPQLKGYNFDEMAASPYFGALIGAVSRGAVEAGRAWNGRGDASFFDSSNPNAVTTTSSPGDQAKQNLLQIAQGKPVEAPAPEQAALPPPPKQNALPAPENTPAGLPAPRPGNEGFVSDGKGGLRPMTEAEQWATQPTDQMVGTPNGGVRSMTQQEATDRLTKIAQMQDSGNTPDVQRASRNNPAVPQQTIDKPNSSTLTSANDDLLKMRDGTQQTPAVLLGLSQQLHEELAQSPSPQRRAAIEGQLSELRTRLQEAGLPDTTNMSGMRENQRTNAPSRLQQTPSGNVAVQDLSSRSAQESGAGTSIGEHQDDNAPSPAQIKAGNYPKGHEKVQGLDISVENPAGSIRAGKDANDQPWAVTMPVDYGYIRGTNGADNEHVDAFLGPNPKSQSVFVVDQKDPATGAFDEHKALIGFDNVFDAHNAYVNSFSDGKADQRIGAFTPMTMKDFKGWMKDGDTTKPLNYDPPLPTDAQGNVTLHHFSDEEGLTKTDPNQWGQKNPQFLPADERNRIGEAPGRTYFGLDDYKKENGLGDNEYTAKVPAEKLYDADKDPRGLQEKAEQRIAAGQSKITPRSEFEQLVKAQGYHGYLRDTPNGKVAAMFHPMDVQAAPLPDHARAVFEVAPDPNNKALTERWNAVEPEARQTITRAVVRQVVPEILSALHTQGRVINQIGGYEGATNPSVAALLRDPAMIVPFSKLAGHVFSQDSTMAIHAEEFPGSQPVGIVNIELPQGDYGFVKGVYDKLWGLMEGDQHIVGGHTTVGNVMSILNYSGLPDAELAKRVDGALGGSYPVYVKDGFAAFPAKEEYGYDGLDKRGSSEEASPLQLAAYHLRRKAARSLEEHLGSYERQARAQSLAQVNPEDVAPPFFSALTRGVDNLKQNKAPASEWSKIIDSLPGVKKEELDWSGVKDWLKEQNSRSVTRGELTDYLRANELQVKDIDTAASSSWEDKVDPDDVEMPSDRDFEQDEIDENLVDSEMDYYREQFFEDNGGDTPEAAEKFYKEESALGNTRRAEAYVNVEEGDNGETTYSWNQDRIDEDVRDQAYESASDSTDMIGSVEVAGVTYDLRVNPNMGEWRITSSNGDDIASGSGSRFGSMAQSARNALWEYLSENDITRDPEGDGTKYSEYQLPGGADYHELLMKLPQREGQNYTQNPHFNEQNVVAHMRFNRRTDVDGKNVMHLEEIQSDWHQQGRRRGYMSEDQSKIRDQLNDASELRRNLADELSPKLEAIDNLGFDSQVQAFHALRENGTISFDMPTETKELAQRFLDAAKRELELNDKLTNAGRAVPDAPFKTTWPELALKRALRYAAENNFDRLSWTTGAQQVDRWAGGLRNAVDELRWEKTDKGIHLIGMKYGKEAVNTHQREDELSDALGKSMSDQIINSHDQSGTIKGDNLTISDTGMAGFYDKMLPSLANKIAKKFGAKVNSTRFMTGERSDWADPVEPDTSKWKLAPADNDGKVVVDQDGNKVIPEMTFSPSTTRDSAIASTVKEYMNRRQKIGTKVHSLDITPEMKASVMQGQPLFQGKASGKPGDYASDLEGFQSFAKNKTGEDLHSAIRDYLIKRGDETGHEHIVIYDAKNGRVVEAGTTGQADKVKVPVSLMPLMEDPANNFTIHHNHTEHLAISYVDLKPLAWPGLRSVVAHTNENGLSAASLSKAAAENIYRDQSFVPIKNITEIEDKARASVIGTLNRAIKAKLLTQKIADTVQTDLVNMALDKAGIINYTTSHDLHESEIKNAAKVVKGAINAAATVAKNHAMEVGVLPKENVNAGTQNDKGVGFGWPTRAIAVSAKDGMAEIYRRDAGAQSGVGAGRNMVSQRNDGNIQGSQNAGEGKGLKPFDLAQFDPEKNREFGKSISTAVAKVEGLIGKAIKGSPIERLAQGYQHLFQPELISEKATLADALVAQSKVKRQDAVNAIAKNIQRYINEWDKVPLEGQKAWMKDYESGKRNHPYDAVHKAMMDATHAAENQAMGRTPDEYYRDNYISHIFDDGDAVKRYFEQQVKKYGNDWFTKKRAFDLVEEAEKAGFKLKTYNPAELDQMRLMAGMDMIQHQQLLDRLAQSGLAAKVKDINKGDLETHISHEAVLDLQANHFQVRAPDNKAWWIHSDLFPLWQNAMEQRGFQGAQNSLGDAYRFIQACRAIQLPIELGFSFFHPMHVYSIHWATGVATAVEHAIKAPSFGEALHGFKEGFMMSSRAGIGPGGLNPIRMLKSGTAMERIASVEHPLLQAYKTPANKRTPWQKDVVDRYNDGGFSPLMSERDKIHFHAALTKAYNQKQFQKLIVPGALGALRAISSPFMEHWIPAMKADAYMTRTTLALRRDPTLATNDDKRAVVFRGIAKDLERTYGEMNYDTLFWNKKLKDVAKVAFISMGWKLAQLYYYMGKPAAEIPQLLYKWAKTGKVDRQAISYQSLMMPAYWIVGTMIGAMTCAALSGHSPHNYMDTQFPPTGEVTSDGTPVRIALPFFNKEAYSLKYHIDQNGPLKGISTFLGDMSPIPNMWSFANNEDHFGNPLISQWNWDQVSHMALYEMRPISKDLYDKAVRNNDKVAAKMAFVGAGVAPQYVGKTTFENKVAAQYYRERGAHGSVYQRDLENQYKQAVAENDQSKMAEARAALQKTGMTPLQVTGLTRAYKEPFINYMWRGTPGNGGGWHGLSAEAQIDLYSSATPAEKKTFYSMMKPDARRQVQPPQ